MRYAVICPGQGSQAIGMGENLYQEFACVKRYFEEASDVLGRDMKALMFEDNQDIHQSTWTQPAVLLVSFCAYKVLEQELGVGPLFALGHSLGEISAVCLAGAMDLQKGLRLVHERGRLMQSCGDSVGMMVVMGLDDSVVEEFVSTKQAANQQIWIANYNADGQIVLAGNRADLQGAVDGLKALKAKRALLLDMSVASHCPLLNDILEPFRALLEDALSDLFAYPIIANATLEQYATKERAIELLGMQLVSPVRYKQAIRKYDAEVDCFVECGHGSVLKGLNARLSPKPTMSVNSVETLKQTLEYFRG